MPATQMEKNQTLLLRETGENEASDLLPGLRQTFDATAGTAFGSAPTFRHAPGVIPGLNLSRRMLEVHPEAPRRGGAEENVF
jgi:hypothetical protein